MDPQDSGLKFLVLSLAAGISKYLHEVTSQSRKFIPLEAISNVSSAVLAGFVIGHLAYDYGMSNSWQMAIVSVAGWSGPIVLNKASEILTKMLPDLMTKGKMALYLMVKPDDVKPASTTPVPLVVNPVTPPLTPPVIQGAPVKSIEEAKPAIVLPATPAPSLPAPMEKTEKELRKERMEQLKKEQAQG